MLPKPEPVVLERYPERTQMLVNSNQIITIPVIPKKKQFIDNFKRWKLLMILNCKKK